MPSKIYGAKVSHTTQQTIDLSFAVGEGRTIKVFATQSQPVLVEVTQDAALKQGIVSNLVMALSNIGLATQYIYLSWNSALKSAPNPENLYSITNFSIEIDAITALGHSVTANSIITALNSVSWYGQVAYYTIKSYNAQILDPIPDCNSGYHWDEYLQACVPDTADTYDVTILTSLGGTTSPVPGRHTGSGVLAITAIPAQGYVFDHWDLNDGFLSSQRTISVDHGPWTVSAFFTSTTVPYEITIVAGTGGTTNPAPGTHTGDGVLSVTAIPAEGYVFDHWNLGGGFLSYDLTIQVDAGPWTVTAFFKDGPTGCQYPYRWDPVLQECVLDNQPSDFPWLALLVAGGIGLAGVAFVVSRKKK